MIVPRLPQRRREIVELTTVVNHMRRPKPAHAMGGAMFPIIKQVLRDERQKDYWQAHAPIKEPKLPRPHQNPKAHKSHQNIGD